jgi:hypothetical protein
LSNINIWTTINTLLALCGAIAIVGGAWTIIKRCLAPAFKLTKKVDSLENKVLANCRLLEEIAMFNKMLCRSMVVLLDHSITGNGIEKVKEIKSEMQNYLIDK